MGWGTGKPVGFKDDVLGEGAGCRSQQINNKNELEYAPTFLKTLKCSSLGTYHIGIYGICPQVSPGECMDLYLDDFDYPF